MLMGPRNVIQNKNNTQICTEMQHRKNGAINILATKEHEIIFIIEKPIK